MLAMQAVHVFSSLLLFTSVSLLSQADPAMSALVNNSTTVAPFSNITTSTGATTTTPTVLTTPTSETVFLTTEIATGPGGTTTTLITYITAPVGVTGVQTSVPVGGTATTTSPGLQTGAASLGRNLEAAAVAFVGLAGWMVVWG